MTKQLTKARKELEQANRYEQLQLNKFGEGSNAHNIACMLLNIAETSYLKLTQANMK